MAGRLLLWVVLAVAAWWLFKPRRAIAPTRASAQADAQARAPETMVDCAACDLHFPASEAVRDGARLYCCTAHRDAGRRRGA
jgi:uncharacterized protein